LIEGYLSESPALRGVVQLLDVRHDPTDDDRAMLDFLAELGVPVIVAATKVDKLRASEVQPRLQALAREVGVDADQIVLSATTGRGRDELAEALVALLSQPDWKIA
jgi:GTP-binding protein